MPMALILLADGTEEMELSVHFVPILAQSSYSPALIYSTITYDTLVRAGVSCASAYVATETDNAGGTLSSPPFARGSRGINILPDMYFSPQECTPVSVF